MVRAGPSTTGQKVLVWIRPSEKGKFSHPQKVWIRRRDIVLWSEMKQSMDKRDDVETHQGSALIQIVVCVSDPTVWIHPVCVRRGDESVGNQAYLRNCVTPR